MGVTPKLLHNSFSTNKSSNHEIWTKDGIEIRIVIHHMDGFCFCTMTKFINDVVVDSCCFMADSLKEKTKVLYDDGFRSVVEIS
jgi:hypothetical protein